ncbi:glucosamine-6-phosphate deaminase [Rhizobiales bacterium TNE-4]|nr:glucosamine-6-phosphate deaminase [Rhizobiales bacterium TNE-4]MBV1827742.1 glucosamine-6-phosphate deaminase [Rhizobiales bacterium TNE-4]
MQIQLFNDKLSLGQAAAAAGADLIRAAIARNGDATIIVATGASQFELLASLVKAPGINWSKVTAFHLDEYVGLPESHGASFRKYLRERFVAHVPALRAFIPVNGDGDVKAELTRLNGLIRGKRIAVCFAGIGENGHLAFNDPPADFETDEPYILVTLDEACRRQQMGEGWFPTLADVPQTAISMSIRQMMKSDTLILSVSDTRKAEAVKGALEGPLSNLCPASIIREHGDCRLFMDPAAASLLSRKP